MVSTSSQTPARKRFTFSLFARYVSVEAGVWGLKSDFQHVPEAANVSVRARKLVLSG
jgi:hypothetical protein